MATAELANARDDYGNTPMHLACFYGHTEAAISLIDADVDLVRRCLLPGALHCLRGCRHCLCLVYSTAFVARTPPLPCVPIN